ncbi:MAG: N-acetyltransferase [Clostridiales bacterium]|nr:N-acetyltransferase [Clostridiales bacterium]
MNIRQEQPVDYDAVYRVVKEAFKSAEHSEGTEQDLVIALRNSKSFIPELSLVAVDDNQIVGHILFTKAFVNDVKVLALAPLSVLPEYQNRGIGLSLIHYGHNIAYELGYRYSVVLGHAMYYTKAGYIPASTYGIKAPFPVEDENFMAICFNEHADIFNGFIEYDEAFGI